MSVRTITEQLNSQHQHFHPRRNPTLRRYGNFPYHQLWANKHQSDRTTLELTMTWQLEVKKGEHTQLTYLFHTDLFKFVGAAVSPSKLGSAVTTAGPLCVPFGRLETKGIVGHVVVPAVVPESILIHPVGAHRVRTIPLIIKVHFLCPILYSEVHVEGKTQKRKKTKKRRSLPCYSTHTNKHTHARTHLLDGVMAFPHSQVPKAV